MSNSNIHPTILDAMSPMIPKPFPTSPAGRAEPTDTQRLDWLMPVISGDDNQLATQRTIALGLMLLNGLEGRAAIDKAMETAK